MTYVSKLKDPRWQKKRLEILNRDNFACVSCGDNESTLHVHHIYYESSDPWDTDINLLQTLCETCHDEEEKDLKESSKSLINHLRSCGLTSGGMNGLKKCFTTDRGWTYYDPAYDILAMAIDDDDIWNSIEAIFWQRLHERRKNDVLPFLDPQSNG